MTTAYIALGSNLGDSRALLGSALSAMDALPDTSLQATSPAYTSAAIGPGDQPDYINLVAELDTRLPADSLGQQTTAVLLGSNIKDKAAHALPRRVTIEVISTKEGDDSYLTARAREDLVYLHPENRSLARAWRKVLLDAIGSR